MNQDAYDALSEDQREVLTAGRAALEPAIEEIEARDEEAMGSSATVVRSRCARRAPRSSMG